MHVAVLVPGYATGLEEILDPAGSQQKLHLKDYVQDFKSYFNYVIFIDGFEPAMDMSARRHVLLNKLHQVGLPKPQVALYFVGFSMGGSTVIDALDAAPQIRDITHSVVSIAAPLGGSKAIGQAGALTLLAPRLGEVGARRRAIQSMASGVSAKVRQLLRRDRTYIPVHPVAGVIRGTEKAPNPYGLDRCARVWDPSVRQIASLTSGIPITTDRTRDPQAGPIEVERAKRAAIVFPRGETRWLAVDQALREQGEAGGRMRAVLQAFRGDADTAQRAYSVLTDGIFAVSEACPYDPTVAQLQLCTCVPASHSQLMMSRTAAVGPGTEDSSNFSFDAFIPWIASTLFGRSSDSYFGI